MRIVAGKFRSRPIRAVKGMNTRPTLDKVKEAEFNSIGPYFEGGAMLDLFGGSGNIGLEALSRGIEQVVFVDKDAEAVRTIKKNCESLQVSNQVQIWKTDYNSALRRCAQEKRSFDLIYLDPPYAAQQIEKIIVYIQEKQLLKKGGRIIAESLREDGFFKRTGDIFLIKEAFYGITRISIYEREEE